MSAIPDAPTPNESDGNPALNGITIHWSAVEFTLSPLLYNVMYTLTRTDESVDSQSELVSHQTTHAKVSTASTAGRRGNAMWTIQLGVFTSGVLYSGLTQVISDALIDLSWIDGLFLGTLYSDEVLFVLLNKHHTLFCIYVRMCIHVRSCKLHKDVPQSPLRHSVQHNLRCAMNSSDTFCRLLHGHSNCNRLPQNLLDFQMHVMCDTLVDPASVVRRTMWVQYTLGRLECKDQGQ